MSIICRSYRAKTGRSFISDSHFYVPILEVSINKRGLGWDVAGGAEWADDLAA